MCVCVGACGSSGDIVGNSENLALCRSGGLVSELKRVPWAKNNKIYQCNNDE